MINREATFRWKGYYPEDLSKGTHKRVWAVCEQCNFGRWVRLQNYRNLCRFCTNSKENNPMYNKTPWLGKTHSKKKQKRK